MPDLKCVGLLDRTEQLRIDARGSGELTVGAFLHDRLDHPGTTSKPVARLDSVHRSFDREMAHIDMALLHQVERLFIRHGNVKQGITMTSKQFVVGKDVLGMLLSPL